MDWVPSGNTPILVNDGIVDGWIWDSNNMAHDTLRLSEPTDACQSKTFHHFDASKPFKSYVTNTTFCAQQKVGWVYTSQAGAGSTDNLTPCIKRTIGINTRNITQTNVLLGHIYTHYYVKFRGLKVIDSPTMGVDEVAEMEKLLHEVAHDEEEEQEEDESEHQIVETTPLKALKDATKKINSKSKKIQK